MSAPAAGLALDGSAPAPGVIASEMAVLGAMIQSRPAAEEAAGTLTSASFWLPFHQIVFEAAESLAAEGSPVDPAAVLGRIPRIVPGRPVSSADGTALASLIPRAGAVGYHARIIAADSMRRQARLIAERILQRTGADCADPAQAAGDARRELDEILGAGAADGAVTAAELIGDVLADLENPVDADRGIPTGLADLDALVPGMRAGQLVIIAGRPGFGKSMLGLNIARQAAVRMRLPVLLMSLEMTRDEVMHRIIAAEAMVGLEVIQRHELDDGDWQRIQRAHDRIAGSGLIIDDAADAGLARLRVRLREMARSGPARLVVVDYLQLMHAGKADSRQQAVADLSRGLKLIAREFAVPVVVCAQLNRGPEQRTDKRPMPSDLRESGAVEADADVIMLLHRPEYYDPGNRPGELDVIVAKDRQGRLGEIRVGFQGEHGRLVDLTRTWSPSSALEAP